MRTHMRVLLNADNREKYPHCPTRVPMAMLCEETAQQNHSQTLNGLESRGGLDPVEMLANIERRRLDFVGPGSMDLALAIDALILKVNAYEATKKYKCGVCGGHINKDITDTKQLCIRNGLIDETVNPGGRELIFTKGRRLQLTDMCNCCDEKTIINFLD